jgi:hypothetical protein
MPLFLTGLIAYAALIVGIVIGGILGSQQPILAFIQSWQTLIAAAIAFIGIWIAWLSVGRQPRVTLISREEDRIERVLPGLYDASVLLNNIVLSLRGLGEHQDRASELLDIQLEKRDKENLDSAVRRALELTDRPTQLRALEVLRELEWRARLLAHRYEKTRLIEKDLNERPNDENLIATLDESKVRLKKSNENFHGTLNKVEGLASEIDEKIRVFSIRLPALRTEIETFFHER